MGFSKLGLRVSDSKGKIPGNQKSSKTRQTSTGPSNDQAGKRDLEDRAFDKGAIPTEGGVPRVPTPFLVDAEVDKL